MVRPCAGLLQYGQYERIRGHGRQREYVGSFSSSVVTAWRTDERLQPDGDIWQINSPENMGSTRGSNSARGFREARGCNACIADLHHGLTASMVLKARRTSDSSNNSADNRSNYSADSPLMPATTTTRLSASNDDEEQISYDSADDVIYERRLGSIATFIPSEGGPGALVEENGPYTVTASSLGLDEPVDEFPVTSEELQDKFPAVDEPAPPRFRNVSDPDQLRRMRNVSDPELPQRLKDKHSMVSMSTASSSFSRSSNDRYTNDNASTYSRGTNFSAMSDGSSACDLSRDPDILALAGLSMKPRPSDDMYEPAPVQRPPMPAKSYDPYSNQVPDEPKKRAEAVLRTQKKLSNNEEEDSFSTRTISTPWPGSSSADNRLRSNTTCMRDDGFVPPQPDMLRPADVLRHRSQTTAALGWNPAATAPLSGSKDAASKPNNFASSCIRPSKPATSTAATVAASVGPTRAVPQRDEATTSSKLYITSAARRGSVPMQQMHRLPVSVLEDSAASGRNDMIPLSQAGQAAPNFVVFSDSRRESIFTRSADGQDMIPLDF